MSSRPDAHPTPMRAGAPLLPRDGRAALRGRRAGGWLAAGLAGAMVLALAAVLLGTGAGVASAASYRYWSFWSGAAGGSWTYQQQGPNTSVPADGSVDGWRFGVSADSADAAKPRRAADFQAVCGATPPAAHGRKRVAVVIDFGTAADAGTGATPPTAKAACAVLDADATSAQALAQLAPPLRYDANGILCAISGYPQRGCGDVVDGTPTTTVTVADGGGKTDGSGATLGWAAGAALLAALAGGTWYQRRRRAAATGRQGDRPGNRHGD